MTTTTRTYALGDILTVTTGIFVSPNGISGVGELLKFMTGESILAHQVPRVGKECGRAILAQHPQLADVQTPEFDGATHVWRWLAQQVERYGAELPIAPLDPTDHTSIDPIAELRMKAPHMQIVEVEVP